MSTEFDEALKAYNVAVSSGNKGKILSAALALQEIESACEWCTTAAGRLYGSITKLPSSEQHMEQLYYSQWTFCPNCGRRLQQDERKNS